MNAIKASLAILSIVALCHAQTYHISGIVMDSAGNGIEGATVRLGIAEITADISTTTGPGGSFTLTGSTGVKHRGIQTVFNAGCPFIAGDGMFTFGIKEKSNVALSVYDVNGRLLALHNEIALPGNHSMALPHCAHGMHICRVALNEKHYTFKSIAGLATGAVPVSAVKDGTWATIAKSEAQGDAALLVTKDGYQLCRLAIKNPDTSGIKITLIPVVTGTVTDVDGNAYRTVKIGNQEWTAENIRTTKFSDGASIPLVADSAAWASLSAPGYCFYNNNSDADTNKKWGALYSWYAVNTGALAPAGWRVPTDADWDTLQNYLIANGYNYDGTTSGNLIAISMAAKTDWDTFKVVGAPGRNLGSNNSSGFSALPGGHRNGDGSFDGQGYNGHWWCATEADSSSAIDHEIYYYFWYLGRLPFGKNIGSSVRLVRSIPQGG